MWFRNKHVDFPTVDTIWQHNVNIWMYLFLFFFQANQLLLKQRAVSKQLVSLTGFSESWFQPHIFCLSLIQNPAGSVLWPPYRWVSVNMVCSCFTELKAFIVSTNSSSSTYWKRTQHMASAGVNSTTHSQLSSSDESHIRKPRTIKGHISSYVRMAHSNRVTCGFDMKRDVSPVQNPVSVGFPSFPRPSSGTSCQSADWRCGAGNAGSRTGQSLSEGEPATRAWGWTGCWQSLCLSDPGNKWERKKFWNNRVKLKLKNFITMIICQQTLLCLC